MYDISYKNVPFWVLKAPLKFIFQNTCFLEILLLYLQLNLKLDNMSQNVVMAIIRHGLTFVGGYLIAKGVITEGMASEVSGLVMTAIATVWSIVEKVKSVSSK